MLIRDLIYRIGETYDRTLGLTGEAQELLREAPTLVEGLLPGGFISNASGGKGVAAIVPWIAVFNPAETDSAQRGMYVVYLFDAEMKTVALSLNQGVTELVDRFGTSKGRQRLVSQATAIRDLMPAEYGGDLEVAIDLRSRAALPRNYEAGNILAITYDLRSLPGEAELLDDLKLFLGMYDFSRKLRDSLRVSQKDTIFTTTNDVKIPEYEPEFKPKNDMEYIQHIAGRTLRKKRDHETVLRKYGEFLEVRHFLLNSRVHPRDLIAVRGSDHWLIEVKVVYRHNGVEAARAALAQLLMYREFLYPSRQPINLLAVFSEDIGSLCVEFLEKLGIASVWKDGPRWSGSPMASSAGLTS